MMDNEKFGNFVKELRKEKNLTQKELAKRINITDKAVSKWERGLSFPDITMLNILSKELDVTVEELLNGEKIKENKKAEKIDVEKAIKEALEKANGKEEKRRKKILKLKKITKILSIIFFFILLILQLIYFYLSYKYDFEYVIDSLFYIVNEVILITAFLFLLFTFKKKKVKIILISIFGVATLINIVFMGVYGLKNKSYITFSSNLKYELVVKQNKETNGISIYKNSIGLFTRPMQNLAEPANELKVQWLSRDIFGITYKNNENKLKEYVLTLDEDTYKSSYVPFQKSLLGRWQNEEQSNKDTKLYVDSKNIRLKINDEEYTFEFDDCVQVREEAIILNSNKVPKYIIVLSNNALLDEKTGIIKKDGTIIIAELSTGKTKKEELYCINSKTDDLSNYNYMNLSAKKFDIENGVLYFSYDGIKTYTVPGDFSNIDSIEDDQYQISENMIVFYYKTTNGKYIVYSKDKGESWQTEEIPSGGNIKSIKFPNADVGYILEFSDEVMSDACGAIYKTTNGGKSWDKVYTGVYNGHDSSFSTGTKMVFANENVGFITMPDIQGEVSDLYITKDGGVTFEKLNLSTNSKCDYYHIPTIENGEIHIKITVGFALNEESYITVENYVSNDYGETFEKE